MAKDDRSKAKKTGKKFRNLNQLIGMLSGEISSDRLIAAIEAAAAAAIATLKEAADATAPADAAGSGPKEKKKSKKRAKGKKQAAAALAPEDIADSHE